MAPEVWYLLIHQLPVRPLYFRARIRRTLGEAGAIPLKKAVYALPQSVGALEKLTRISDEIRSGGGEAFVCEATFLNQRDGASLIETNRAERAADYDRVLRAVRALRATVRGANRESATVAARLATVRAQLEQIRSIDFSATPGGAEVQVAIEAIDRSLRPGAGRSKADAKATYLGRTWVTRRGLHVDRLACAWVVRRFVDSAARFRFANPDGLRAGPGELTFDTPGGHFSHEEGRCSIETVVVKLGIDDQGVKRIAEIVHDIDIKDRRFGHPETAGVEQLVAGIVQGIESDRARLERGLALFDDLYHSYRRPARVSLKTGRIPKPPHRRSK